MSPLIKLPPPPRCTKCGHDEHQDGCRAVVDRWPEGDRVIVQICACGNPWEGT